MSCVGKDVDQWEVLLWGNNLLSLVKVSIHSHILLFTIPPLGTYHRESLTHTRAHTHVPECT